MESDACSNCALQAEESSSDKFEVLEQAKDDKCNTSRTLGAKVIQRNADDEDASFYKHCTQLVPENYVQHARNAAQHATKRILLLLEQRKLPGDGFDELLINRLLGRFASLDANNYGHACGMGEREGRIYSSIVARRHFFLSHGVGRSGDLAAVQPKATGSSVLARLANDLAVDALRIAGVDNVKCAAVIPLATGMTLSICMQAIRERRGLQATYVLWSRVDQKSCAKCIATAGLDPVIIPQQMDYSTSNLCTDMKYLQAELDRIGDDNKIVCVMSTTSAFAPRSPDRVIDIACLCRERNIPHLINNAYGTQSKRCMHMISEAARQGRVDAFVQSLDKNYMVPVGGAVVATFDRLMLDDITRTYPGRASASPAIDFLITMLHMGRSNYERLLKEREETFEYLREQLASFAMRHGEQVVYSPDNRISLAMSLRACVTPKDATKVGAMLFARGVSGVRVCVPDAEKVAKICRGIELKSFSTHYDTYPFAYLTVAAAIGGSKGEVDVFFKRLEAVIKQLSKAVRRSA